MKFAFAVLALLAAQSSFASAPANTFVTCTPGACRDVEPPQGGGSWCDPSVNATPFKLDLSLFKLRTNGKAIEFISADGDQYGLFILETSDASSLQPGQTVNGSMSDAYWWADGDHIRSTTDMVCTKN